MAKKVKITDIDDLRLEDLEEEILGKGRTQLLQSPSAAEREQHSTLKRAFHHFKMGFLVVIWLITVIFLLIKKENYQMCMFWSVPAQGVKEYEVSTERVEIEIEGTFLPPGVAPADEANLKVLSLQMERIYYDSENKVVQNKKDSSDEETLKLLDDVDTGKSRLRRVSLKISPADLNDGESAKVNLKLSHTHTKDLAVLITVNENPINKRDSLIYGILLLLFLYSMIITDLIDRTFAAVISATLGIAVLAAFDARPSFWLIMEWMDIDILILLFGMMILVAILSDSGIFDFLAVYAFKITKGKIWPLIFVLSMFVATLSTILDNVTMMLLIAPVTLRLCEVSSLNPVPVILCIVMFSNVGAALTPVGDPPNVIIALNERVSASGIHFFNFTMHMLPGVIFGLIQTALQLRFMFRDPNSIKYKNPEEEEIRHQIKVWTRAAAQIDAFSKDEELVRGTLLKKVELLKKKLNELSTTSTIGVGENYEETLENLKESYPIRNKMLLYKSVVVFVFVVLFFGLHSIPHFQHLDLAWTALTGCILLIILAEVFDMEELLAHVEWSTLLFFGSLLILMEVLSLIGVIDEIGKFVHKLIAIVQPPYQLVWAIVVVLWITAIASAFLSNIPVTSMMLKIIIALDDNEDLNLPLHPLLWALAFGACFGGNGTLIGATANVVSAGIIQQHGFRLTFLDFFKVGFPLMLGNITVVTVYLLLAHCVFEWHDQ